MKFWKFFIALSAALLIAVGVGWYVSFSPAPKPEENVALNTPSPAPVQVTPSPTPYEKHANAPADVPYPTSDAPKNTFPRYILKEHLGRIAVYKVYATGEMSIMSIVDTAVEALPESDQKLLKEGINLDTKEDMLKLLEDYTS